MSRDGRRSFSVSSFTGVDTFRVTLAPPSCDCPDVQYNGAEMCKHMIAAALATAGAPNGGH